MKPSPAPNIYFVVGDPAKASGQWFGYPTCFTVWDPSVIKDKTFKVGQQFVVAPNATVGDDLCVQKATPPRLSIQAHSAPIDGKFDKDFKNMFVSLHGSWDRKPATGYKVIQIPYTKLASGAYDPVAATDSKTGYTDVFWSENVGSCSGGACLRPTGLTWDRYFTRLYVASDSNEGELFLLYRA